MDIWIKDLAKKSGFTHGSLKYWCDCGLLQSYIGVGDNRKYVSFKDCNTIEEVKHRLILVKNEMTARANVGRGSRKGRKYKYADSGSTTFSLIEAFCKRYSMLSFIPGDPPTVNGYPVTYKRKRFYINDIDFYSNIFKEDSELLRLLKNPQTIKKNVKKKKSADNT